MPKRKASEDSSDFSEEDEKIVTKKTDKKTDKKKAASGDGDNDVSFEVSSSWTYYLFILDHICDVTKACCCLSNDNVSRAP